MELKTVRQPLSVNEAVFNGGGEIPVDEDIILPDYYAQINKLLKCRMEGRITSKSINGKSVTVDGHICINIMYCDKNCKIHNYEHISPVSRSFDASCDLSGALIETCLKTEYNNCRVVTERKVSVHGALSLTLTAFLQKKYEVIADIGDKDIQIDRIDMPALNTLGNAEKNLLIEEVLTLSQGQPDIEGILRYCADTTVNEVKAVRNKVSVKGSISLNVLYKAKDNCAVYKSAIPFSQLIDIGGISEDCVCTAKVQLCYLEVTPAKGADSVRSMNFNAKLSVTAHSYCDDIIPVITDAYSTDCNLQLNKTDLSVFKIVGHISDTFMFKQTVDFDSDGIAGIIDSWSETEVSSCSFSGNELTANLKINLCILAQCTDGNVSYFEKRIDTVYKKQTEYDVKGSLLSECDFEPVSVSYTLISDSSIDYRIEFRVNISLSEENKVKLLTEIGRGESLLKDKNKDCSLIIYYAGEGERIWDIAKRYNSDVEQIREINSIKCDVLEDDKQLLIPLF